MRRADALAAAALVVMALALHARFLSGQATVAWDAVASLPPWSLPGPVWNPLLQDVALLEHPHALAWDRAPGPWNPGTALGQPAGTYTHPFRHYPVASLLAAVAPPWVAKGLGSLLHVLAAGGAAYGWLRWRGHGPRAALLGALAWQLSPMNTQWLEFSHRVALSAWAPLAVWGAEATARALTLRPAALTAMALAGATCGGLHDQTAVLLYLATGAVLLVEAPLRARPARALALLLVALGGGAALAAWRLVPMGFELLDGARERIPWAVYFDTTLRLEARHLVLALLPEALGGPQRGFAALCGPDERYGNLQELILYVGLPALALAAAGVERRRSRTAGLAAVAGAAVLLALPTPLAYPLWAFVPGFGASAPTRILWVVHLLAPPLVAAGAGRAFAGARGPRTAGLLVATATLAAALVASLPAGYERLLGPGVPAGERAVLARAITRSAVGFGARGLGRNTLPAWAPLQQVHGRGREGVRLSPTLGPSLIAGGLLAATLLLRGRAAHRRHAGAALLVALQALDALHLGVSYNGATPPGSVYPETPGLARARSLAGEGRALLDRGCFPNVLLPFGVREVGGYGAVFSSRVAELLGTLGGRSPHPQLLFPARLPPRWRDALAVGVVITAPGHAPTRPEGLVADLSDGGMTLWRNPTVAPRARLVEPRGVTLCPDRRAALTLMTAREFDPLREVAVEAPASAASGWAPGPAAGLAGSGRASLERDEPTRVELRVDAPRGGVVVLADAWARGWVAVDDHGQPLVTAPVDVALRGALVPPGFSGRVVWTYRTPGRVAGAALSALAALGLALAARRR